VIEPRKDAYGAEADTTHLADYLELLAMASRPLKRADLSDFLGDTNWPVRSRELYHAAGPGTPGAEPSEDELGSGAGVSPADEAAGRVFDLLTDREAMLGDRYPFANDGVQLRAIDPLEDRHSLYLALLAITVAHHYSIAAPAAPEDAFEAVVADAMGARGLLTIDMGHAGRTTSDFRAAVRVAGEAIGVLPSPGAAPSKRHANEEGVDTISNLSWGDTRAGHWLFIGQATCAKSGEWRRKIAEPKPGQWGRLLGSVIRPIAYLAVPHHMETPQMLHLSTGDERLVLDRLRLCRYLSSLGVDQQGILDAVLNESVYHPAYA
jgi:hypothetical protein